MKILILGTRGEIEETLPRHSNHSGILVDDELLIDLGEKHFLQRHPKWVLITHFHPDHAYFVRHGHEEIPEANIPIYAPEVPDWLQGRVTAFHENSLTLGPYTVIPIPTHHSKHVKSQAYVIKKGKQTFLYTGDLVWIDKQYHSLIDHVNLVITEASFIRKGGLVSKDPSGLLYGHNGVPNIVSLVKNFSRNILLTHFGSWFYTNIKEARQKLQLLAKEQGVHIVVGYDGLSIDVDEYPKNH